MSVEALWGVYILSFVVFAIIYLLIKGKHGHLSMGLFVAAILADIILAILIFSTTRPATQSANANAQFNGLLIFAGVLTIGLLIWVLVDMRRRQKKEMMEIKEEMEEEMAERDAGVGSCSMKYRPLDEVVSRNSDGTLNIKYLV